MVENQTMVDVGDLVKVYPGGNRAVAGIDFTVGKGEFFGFLGPNGPAVAPEVSWRSPTST